eukprot:g5479.t1
MAGSTSLAVVHVLNPDHDALKHSAVFEEADGSFFCVHCAAERYTCAPAFRRLALLDGIRSIFAAHGGVPPSLRMGGVDACLPMILDGVGSADAGVVQAATDIMLALKDELDDPVGVLASLVSSTVSLGLPRASGHIYLIGQLLTNASHDLALATVLGNACFGRYGRDNHHPSHPLGVANGSGGGGGVPGGGCGGCMTERRGVEQERFQGFGSFLASHALSASCQDHVKSDVLFVALELLDCCATAGATIAPQASSFPRPESDPFVSIMLGVPWLLAGRPSCDEPLQLHSIAYLATATAYCRLRTEMGVPGWSYNACGVPEVLVALVDGAREFSPREMVAGGGGGGSGRSLPTSSDGLCNTLKTLLMASSYWVRSATARLVTSLCSDSRFSEHRSEADENAAVSLASGGRKTGGLFFREVLIAAGETDFLFEAIKSEREGTPRFYFEALEAFALSPVEFFHANNFSMKFAAPVLLSAFRGGGGCDGGDGGTRIDSENEAVVFSLSSRLLLQALVMLPSSGVVEELLATAAASTQLDTPHKTRALGLAADVLSLIASKDISLSKDRGQFLDAVAVLLDQLEEHLARAAHKDSLQAPAEAAAPSPSEPVRLPATRRQQEYRDDDDGLILQCTRVYESLLHTAEDWVSSQRGSAPGVGPPLQVAGRRFRRGEQEEEGKEGDFLADLVFAAYACTLRYQCVLVARSHHLTHDVAFLSCLGAALDAASSVLFSDKLQRGEESAGAGSNGGRAESSSPPLRVRPSFVGVRQVEDHTAADAPAVTSTAASCLETVLSVAVDADVVSWMLELYARCGTVGSSSGDGGDACGATTRELLVEILQSFLFAQGWANGLCAHGVPDGPSCRGDCSDGDGGVLTSGFSTFGDTVRLVVKSWSASGEGIQSSLDHYALSLLGTNADNGNLCELVALLVSLSPTFQGMLYPHVGCRLDAAVTLLRYVKTVPEAVFCLNLLSHIFLSGDRQTFGTGCGRHLPGLGGAVKDLLARFPVGDMALSPIPLSAASLLFFLLAGCDAFFADWLVAAPLVRIERALDEFGASRGGEERTPDDAMGIAADGSEQRSVVAVSAQEFGREALAGVLETALSRWGAEIEDSLQHHSQSDAVILRLASVLSMSPDVFFSLAFEVDSQSDETRDGEQRCNQELAGVLGTVIPETLEILSVALSPVVSRRGDRGNENCRASKLACVSRVSQLASAFLRARCEHGYYAPAGSGMHGSTAPSSRSEPPELSLARACGALLRGVLDRRRGQGPNGGGGNTNRALLSVLNLLNALLVLAGGDSDLLRPDVALQESHAALSEVLATTAVAIERLMGWLELAPDTLAAFLQACVLWNAAESKHDVSGDDPSCSRLNPPFQVLREVLSSGGGGPCVIVGNGAGKSSNNNKGLPTQQAPSTTPRRAVRRSLLEVLAMRCVESAVQTRFFSHQEVLALQLILQGMACDSSPTVASAAHGAIQALWEAYAGFIQNADLVEQSWNPFVVECSLENALRSLSGDPGEGNLADLLRVVNDPRELRVDPPVVVSTIGRLLRWCEGKACPRLSHSKASDLEVLSEMAAVYIHQCALLLATNLRLALGDGVDLRDDQQQRDRSGGLGGRERREEGMRGDATFHLSDALEQMVQVLMCIQPLPQGGLAVEEGLRRELVDALLALHPALLRFGGVRPLFEQVSMPLSRGAYHDCALSCCAFNGYEVLEAGSSLTAIGSDDISSNSSNKKGSTATSSTALDLASIAPMINVGFRAVLNEASRLGVLDPPHGRTPMPDPKKITEVEAFASGSAGDNDNSDRGEETGTDVSEEPTAASSADLGEREEDDDEEDDDDDDDDDKLLDYKFEYGFNPLVFLGEYLLKNNPAAVRAREEQRRADHEYLRHRADRCLAREEAVVELRDLVAHRQSGITHGPIVGEVSDCGGIVWARAFRSGQCTIELSRHEDFHSICRQGVVKVDQGTECSAIVEFDDLDPNTIWYHRSYLHNPRKGFDGPAAGFCVKGKFSTLPERDEDSCGTFRLAVFSLHGLGLRSATAKYRSAIEKACSAVSAAKPGCCLILGGPSRPQGLATGNGMMRFYPGSFNDLHETAARIPVLSRLLQGNGILTASGLISKTVKRQKTPQGKHHHRSAKPSKHGNSSTRADGTATAGGAKKSPKVKRSSTRAEGESLAGGGEEKSSSPPPPDWPLRCPAAWGSRPFGPTAEVFIIDARAGFLGEEQLAWVAEAVEESRRTWKVIACGVSVGFPIGPVVEAVQEEEQEALINAAAVTIQARLRSHLQSKRPPPSPNTTTAATATTTTPTTTTTATKKSAATPSGGGAGGAGGGGVQQRGSPLPSSAGKDCNRSSPVAVNAGGTRPGSGGGGGGVASREECPRNLKDETAYISRATVQMQSLVSQLHTSGCSNVVLVTPARSRPHALAFLSGHEAEGRFPVYELGCSALVPLLLDTKATSSAQGGGSGKNETDEERPEPCPNLAPRVLIPELETLLSACGDDDGGGFACTLSFGREEGREDWLSFVVGDAGGGEIASLTLPAAA